MGAPESSLSLAVASDIHVEFQEDDGEAFVARMPDAEVLVCAGDLASSSTLEPAIEHLCARYPQVVYVMGNHEPYGSSIRDVRGRLTDAATRLPNLHYLENDTCEIAGQRFVGTTLWTPRAHGIEALEDFMNDFRLIADAQNLYDENARAVRWLRRTVRSTDVVVTHHLPSPRSTHPRFARSPINCFFVCDVEDVIEQRQPRLWIHGHTHESMDYRIGETRVLCNPYGYEGVEPNADFDATLTVELAPPA